MKNNISHILIDISEEEAAFLNELTRNLKDTTKAADLNVLDIVAVIGYEQVVISDRAIEAITNTRYANAYGIEEVKQFFKNRVRSHISQANDIAYSNDVVTITSISSKEIQPSHVITNIPGSGYHQDGRGIPYSTKITLISKRIWMGGELHILDLPDDPSEREKLKCESLGMMPTKIYGNTQVLLEEREAILFDNRNTLHAVNSKNLKSMSAANRIIFQERINNAHEFNYTILNKMGITEPLTKTPSTFSTVLTGFLNPRIKGKRYKSAKEVSHLERAYISQHERPDLEFRNNLRAKLDANFGHFADQFEQDGILILPSFLTQETLRELQEFFAQQIAYKKLDPLLQQASFNGAVDKEATLTKVGQAVTSWPLLATIADCLGQPPVLANWRGYRLESSEPLLYRAWDWHNDQKRKEVKIMILLSDVSENGQAMQVIKGSHKKWWNIKTQADTKYTIDEAIKLGNKESITKCCGPAGTVIIFDTNIVHRGTRGNTLRDVMTFNFLPNNSNAPLFPIAITDNSDNSDSYRATALTRINPIDKDPKDFFLSTLDKDEIDRAFREKEVITTENDTNKVETAHLIEEYQDTPRYPDIKPRYNENNASLSDFLYENALNDFNADLDLPVRLGKEDVDRDIQFVVFRDRSPSSIESLHLKKLLSETKPDFKFHYSVEYFKQSAKRITLLKENESLPIRRCAKLAEDLHEAFVYCDTPQRLRTNIIYLYAMYDFLHCLMPANDYEDTIRDLLQAYVQIIYLDDFVETNMNGIRSGFNTSSDTNDDYFLRNNFKNYYTNIQTHLSMIAGSNSTASNELCVSIKNSLYRSVFFTANSSNTHSNCESNNIQNVDSVLPSVAADEQLENKKRFQCI